jgi:CBS domain-containing protein
MKVRAGEPVRNALRLMLEHEISGIPVLNDQGVLLDMYCDSGKGCCTTYTVT